MNVSLSANNFAFDRTTITVRPSAQVTVTFTNNEALTAHNFALYESAQNTATPIHRSDYVSAGGTGTFTFTAPATPGTYFFRCDIHLAMTGSLVVAADAPLEQAPAAPATPGTDPYGY